VTQCRCSRDQRFLRRPTSRGVPRRCRRRRLARPEIWVVHHRYYDPVTSQFVSVDPLVDETGTPYAFTEGDPVNGSDPGGLCNMNPFSGSFWSAGNCISQAATRVGDFVNNESQTIDCNLLGGGNSIFNGVFGCANDKNGPACATSGTNGGPKAGSSAIGLGSITGGNLNWKPAKYYKNAGINPERLKDEYGYGSEGDLRVQSGSGRRLRGAEGWISVSANQLSNHQREKPL